MSMGRPLTIDLDGQQFGRLTVIARAPSRHNKVYWLCMCECGGMAEVQTFDLLMGHTRSCGCYQRERASEIRQLSIQRNSGYKR